MPTKPIPDLSEHNGPVDWPRLAPHISGAMLRVSSWRVESGGNRDDRQILANIEGARFNPADDVPVGGYCRALPWALGPEAECRLFLDRLHRFGLDQPGSLIPAIDIEPSNRPELDALVDWPAWTRDFFRYWNETTNRGRIQFYSSGSYFDSKYGGTLDIPLNVSFWVGDAAGFKHDVSKGGQTKWTIGGRTLLHQVSHEWEPEGTQGKTDANVLMPYTTLDELTL